MLSVIKNNLAVVVGISLPILLVLFLVVSIYLPSLFVNPEYNFIYALCSSGSSNRYVECANYRTGIEYDVVDGKVVRREIERTFIKSEFPSIQRIREGVADVVLFFHDVDSDTSSEITLDEARGYEVSGKRISPDGFIVDRSRRNGGGGFFPFFYGGGSRSAYVLKKGDRQKEINLIADADNYYYWYGNSFEFVGWVIDKESDI